MNSRFIRVESAAIIFIFIFMMQVDSTEDTMPQEG